MKQKALIITFESDLIWVVLLMGVSYFIGYLIASYLQRRKWASLTTKLQEEVIALRKTPDDIKDIDVFFSEIKPKIVEVVKETQSTISNSSLRKEVIAKRTRENFVSYTREKEGLNFERIGYASQHEKDDLTKIIGIGPFIEQRLNSIGVYTFDQISKLTSSDIRKINELIDFFPERIEKDNWIGQAESLKF